MRPSYTIRPLLCISFYLITFQAVAQNEDQGNIIGFDPVFSSKMLDPNQDLRKVSIFIDEKQNNVFDKHRVIIGASIIALMDYQKSNTDSKFGYLMRHPTSSNQIGKEVSEAVIHSFQLSVSGSVNNWLAAYTELLYNPEQSFGSGNITSLERNQIQLRKGYVVVGDLNEFPFYGAIGKMDAPFGQTGSVNPFSNSSMWHAFGGLGYGAQVSFKKWGLHSTFMAVQGGAQFRAMNTSVGDSTNVPSQLNNFVADINYSFNLSESVNVRIGASYLHGSAYCQSFPVTHFSPCAVNNPANTFYGRIVYKNRLTIKGGFAQTENEWPGTHNPQPPLNIFEASKVTSLDAGARYEFNLSGKTRYAISGEFSNFKAGPDDAPWERQSQIIAGFSAMLQKSSVLFIEIFRTDGFTPLNFISGSAPNAPFPPGTTHSEHDAFSHGIVAGAQLVF